MSKLSSRSSEPRWQLHRCSNDKRNCVEGTFIERSIGLEVDLLHYCTMLLDDDWARRPMPAQLANAYTKPFLFHLDESELLKDKAEASRLLWRVPKMVSNHAIEREEAAVLACANKRVALGVLSESDIINSVISMRVDCIDTCMEVELVISSTFMKHRSSHSFCHKVRRATARRFQYTLRRIKR